MNKHFNKTGIYKALLSTMVVFLLTYFLPAEAVKSPRATSMDSRLRVMAYNPNDVYKYTGYYGYQGSIAFEADETIGTISMGDTKSWQIIPSGNRMFLKPIESNASTNMTVITNKRLYFFELHAAFAKGPNDPGMVFSVKFLYPESNIKNIQMGSANRAPDLANPSKYNFNYTISGSNIIAPIKIFDDGRFTYFEFYDKNAPVPAIFEVDRDKNESIINYQVVGQYIVVESLAAKFTLRYGAEITCVFNENKHERFR